ncbi:MAG: stp 6 [Marmoricola sp.]|nr:stp 6 [Marmoricola sp.]
MPFVRSHHRITFTVLMISVASFALLQSLVVPVLTELQRAFETDQATVTWVLTAYLLSASICTPLLGRLGDVLGKKRILVVTLAALSVGSLMAALSPSIEWLILARIVQGAGGGVLPLAFGIIRDEFPREKMNGALSIVASLAAVGFGIGIVVAGPIVDLLSYHWLFWLPMIATALAALGAVFLVPESPVRTPGRIPVLPALLLSAWLVALLLGLSQGNRWGWGSPGVLSLFAASVVLAGGWILVETRVPVPLIDMQMMRLRGVWTTNVVAAFVGFGVYASFGFLPQLLQTSPEAGYGFGATTTESGRLLLPSAVASFLVGFMTARLMRVFGARIVIVSGSLFSAVAFASIALWHDATWQLYAATTLQGVGSGLIFSSLAGVVIASVPPEQTGVASGMNANIRTIGGSIGSAVMAGVVTASLGPSGMPVERGYVVGFALLAGGMVLAAAAGAVLPDIHDQPTHDALEDAENAGLGLVPGGPALTEPHGPNGR